MFLFKLFIVGGLFAIGVLSVEAADLETKSVDKNCWIEVFDDSKYDADDPHVKLQGPKEYASLKNLNGKNWNNDIQSVIVGSDATVRVYSKQDFKGTELAFLPGQHVPDLSKLDMSNEIESMKIACGESEGQNQPSSSRMGDQQSNRIGTQPSGRPSDPTSSTSTTTTTTTTMPPQ
ncbi:MAG: hypothetical protein ABIO96_11125 [Nitrospiraceae bacterium]